MKTKLDCLPCLYKQALYTSRLCTESTTLQHAVLQEVADLLKHIDLHGTPPENSIEIYRTIARLCNQRDPFLQLKQHGNDTALAMLNAARERIKAAQDPLFTAILLAIAGNIIDYGSHQDFDLQKTVDHCLTNPPTVNSYKDFQKDLKKARTILYLGDNCGELVFDKLLIERLQKPTYFAVKESPIINDALWEDAVYCGLDKLCTIVSNGTDCPGTPLQQCDNDFREIFNSADMVISKGQGNFETLSDVSRPIYFLLTVKCQVVAEHLSKMTSNKRPIEMGESVFLLKE